MRRLVICYDRFALPYRRALGTVVGLIALIATSPAAAQPAYGERTVGRVSAVRGPGSASRIAAARAAKTRCVGIDHVAGAVVFGDRAVELTMQGGSRWRMTFAQSCPALSFYQGFYYRRAIAGKLCAGRDAVIARSGGDCPIDTITMIGRARR